MSRVSCDFKAPLIVKCELWCVDAAACATRQSVNNNDNNIDNIDTIDDTINIVHIDDKTCEETALQIRRRRRARR